MPIHLVEHMRERDDLICQTPVETKIEINRLILFILGTAVQRHNQETG